MAGGNFDINTPKVRPGDYINYKAKKNYAPSSATRGTCVIPLVGYDWGPDGKVITLTPDAPDAEIVALGRSIYAENDLVKMVRLALDNASVVHVYIIAGGKNAKGTQGGLTVTAKYAGTRGNAIKVTSVENTDAGFDVSVYLDGEVMETVNGVETIEALIKAGSQYVDYSGTGVLTAFAGLTLTGGESATNTNAQFTTFLDRVEKINCDTVCIPVTEESLLAAAVSKCKYLRTKSGKTVQFVVANNEADDIGVINVTNAFEYYGVALTPQLATAWVTGATCGADHITSNTYKIVKGGTGVVGELSNEQTIEAIKAGHFVFSVDDEGQVIVEYDINSLVHPNDEQDDSYKKNRVIRVFDSFANTLKATFPPNKFDNDEDGWAIMEGLGKAILQKYADDGAIKNVDYDSDFLVDQSRSVGDSTYFNIALQPVDSAEKLYFSICTQ